MKIYQVDAFTESLFGGNPAAVCPLTTWISDAKMQQIAAENNLSETAFIVKEGEDYIIRWFTPKAEIDLCGHATLGAAHVIFEHLGHATDEITFHYKGGDLRVARAGDLLRMDFPSVGADIIALDDNLKKAFSATPREVYQSRDLMLVFDNEEEILAIKPDLDLLAKLDCLGVIVTSKGNEVDFVSRFFAPKVGIAEDPVTGSAHCMLIPFWSKRLGKINMDAIQLSERRGHLTCAFLGNRVEIGGKAVTYMIGDILI